MVDLSRRTLLSVGGAALAGSMLPLAAAQAATDAWQAEFAAALARTPWLIGWRDVGVERLDTAEMVIEGAWPKDLTGRFYRNGPARHERGGQRYHHWFDGDGMVHEYRIADGRVAHRGRMIRTSKYQAEERAGHFLSNGFGTLFPGASYGSVNAINVANINILPVGNQLLALWEGGPAWSLDPVSLEAQGAKSWRPDLANLPFSAHPKVEPDGTVWNFGTGLDGRALIYRITPAGDLADVSMLPLDQPSMIHDFIVTERHLVFLLAPLLLDRARLSAGETFLDAHVWHPDRPMRVMVVAKDDPTRLRRYDLAAGFTFHFGNGWEERDGTIRFDHCRRSDPSAMFGPLRAIMRGAVEQGADARWSQVTLFPDGRAEEQGSPEHTEFGRVDPRVVGRRNRFVYLLEASAGRSIPLFDTVVRRDWQGGADRFSYGPDVFAEEHVFVPRPGSTAEGDGWLIGTVLDWRRGRTGLSVFRADRLADGPLARAWLPYAIPLGLHGTWLS